jgi:hypothetical protein
MVHLDYGTTLTEDQQVAFAEAIAQGDERRSFRLASVLSETATSPRIVPYLKKAVPNTKIETQLRHQIVEAWARVDMVGAKDEALAIIREGNNRMSEASGSPYGPAWMDTNAINLMGCYMAEPEVKAIIGEIIGRADESAVNLAEHLRLEGAIPMLLQRAKSRTSYPRPISEANALLKITSHTVALKKDGTAEEDREAFENWERWWKNQKGK